MDEYVFLNDRETFSPMANSNIAVVECSGDNLLVTTYSIEKMYRMLTDEQKKQCEVPVEQETIDELAQSYAEEDEE